MLRLFFLSLIFVSTVAIGQQKNKDVAVDSATQSVDSAVIADLKETVLENIPEVTIDENDINGEAQSSISPLLLSSRDPFFSAATFNFGSGRFRFRGYSNDYSTTYMNGLNMQNLESGFTPFSQWSGLNYVLYNRQITFGLTPASFGYGNLGTTTNIDTRASRQRKQTRFGYAYSNGNYTHRVSLMHSTGLSRKGWALTYMGAFRGADEGYAQGTYANNYSYFIGIDKKFSDRHLLSLVAFAAPSETGIAGTSTLEMLNLANDKYYNPNWGYQNGKKRNARIIKSNQPVFILSHEFKITKTSNLMTAVGYTFGDRSISGLDWYNSADPRPDYYRYLPSYQEMPELQDAIGAAISNDINKRQINWAQLYDANRNNSETVHNVDGIQGNDVSGLRSSYIVSKQVTNTRRGSLRSVFNQKLNKNIDFSFGLSHQIEKNNYYRQVDDLLGGEFYVDRNQFAERDFPSNPLVGQNDLNHPNRILKVGDRYAYDYDMVINKSTMFSQTVFKFKKFDFFAAGELSNSQFWRVGNTRNGLFPNDSYGKSTEYSFNNYSVKAGFSYRINLRNYFYVNASQMTRAPFYRSVYISPRTRDFVQDNVKSELVKSIEGGYVILTPDVKIRLSGYYTKAENTLNVLTFYHDVYRSFVNYALSNMGKVDFGGELGFESRAIKNIVISGAAAVGRHYYNGRPEVIVTQDNSSQILAKETIYAQNYRVENMPQEAYNLGVQYRSPHYWYIGANVNYFDQIWLGYNPIRRTTSIASAIPYKSDLWNQVLDQQRLSGQTMTNVFAGYTWKVPRSLAMHRKLFFSLNANVYNVLDNKDFVTGGREQLRYDNVDNNVNKFPSRYFYAYGRTYSISATIRF